MPKNTAATTNFNARISLDQKDLIQRAAEMRGVTMTDFVLQAAHDRAVETIEQESVLKLSLEDAVKFQAAIDSPPSPNEQVFTAFERAPRASVR